MISFARRSLADIVDSIALRKEKLTAASVVNDGHLSFATYLVILVIRPAAAATVQLKARLQYAE